MILENWGINMNQLDMNRRAIFGAFALAPLVLTIPNVACATSGDWYEAKRQFLLAQKEKDIAYSKFEEIEAYAKTLYPHRYYLMSIKGKAEANLQYKNASQEGYVEYNQLLEDEWHYAKHHEIDEVQGINAAQDEWERLFDIFDECRERLSNISPPNLKELVEKIKLLEDIEVNEDTLAFLVRDLKVMGV